MRVFDGSLRVLGAVLAALMAAGSAVLDATATPRLWLIPVICAVVGNMFLVWFAMYTVDRRWAWAIPTITWVGGMILLVAPTAEGDQLANSWTGLATFAAGCGALFLSTTFHSNSGKWSTPPPKIGDLSKSG